MKILIIQQKMIGDVLTSSILFESLRHKFPEAQLDYLINTHTYPVVENNPFIDNFIFITPEIEKSKLKFFAFLKTIRKAEYDAVIDVYGKISSALICLFVKSKIKSAYRKKHTAFIYSHTTKRLKHPENNSSLAFENRFKLLEPLQINFNTITPKIYLTATEIKDAKLYLIKHNIDLTNPLYMISVLGSSENKTYPKNYMAQLLDTIVEQKPDSRILFNYIPKQREDAKAIFDACNQITQQHILFDIFGKSLREFLAITKHCTALIGNEGGANNMAKALGIKTFTIFSPYLNKKNWFGDVESDNQHVAIHISDFIPYSENDIALAKKNIEAYYLKLKPEYIKPKLISFLNK
ncbi:glycosyltransferase family 9 protein [Algibacter sp. AS12]|uniref:glycosyltransferase family 9 protein n=1 Tax=Algibacter sp. AS12 TaxID=3135773 RepID=UPI00398B7C53